MAMNPSKNQDSYLSAKQVQSIIPFSAATISRLAKDENSEFPQAHCVGRSLFWKSSDIFQYLSDKSGIKIAHDDRAINASELKDTFNKSHTWLWQNIKNGRFPEPFKINRSRFWMKSQIDVLLQNNGGSNANW